MAVCIFFSASSQYTTQIIIIYIICSLPSLVIYQKKFFTAGFVFLHDCAKSQQRLPALKKLTPILDSGSRRIRAEFEQFRSASKQNFHGLNSSSCRIRPALYLNTLGFAYVRWLIYLRSPSHSITLGKFVLALRALHSIYENILN